MLYEDAPGAEATAAQRGAALCPFDFNAQRNQGEVYGIVRVTRRPELWGFALRFCQEPELLLRNHVRT
eukprot:4903136-Amphidinium_carterae.1